MSFKNKVVLVTGSSSGIGASTAIQFAKEGASVVIVGRNEIKLKTISQQIQSFGNGLLAIKADVSKDSDGKRIVDETVKKFGKIDVLVNSAGTCKLFDITKENFMHGFDEIFNTNLRGMVFITHCTMPHLIKTKGNIINISSIGGVATTGSPNLTPYCVAKAGVNHFTRSAALKLSSFGVRVNSVSPGVVRTDIKDVMQLPLTWEQIAETTPLKRISEPKEIADLVLFLASDKACGITGSDFVSDNGLLIMN